MRSPSWCARGRSATSVAPTSPPRSCARSSRGRVNVAALQNEYSLLDHEVEEEVLPLCREHGVGFVPFAPLGRGLLAGNYRRGEPAPEGTRLHGRDEVLTDEVFDRIDTLAGFAADRGRTLLDVAIAGLASQPGVASVIAGASSPEQVRANASAGEWELTRAELDELAAL